LKGLVVSLKELIDERDFMVNRLFWFGLMGMAACYVSGFSLGYAYGLIRRFHQRDKSEE
jgi:hypothetical protein